MGKGFGCPKKQQKSSKSKKIKKSNAVELTEKELEIKAEYYVTHRTLDGFPEYLDHVREQKANKIRKKIKRGGVLKTRSRSTLGT
jgi:hypothetical protein